MTFFIDILLILGISLAFGPFNAYNHDSTCVKLIRLENKLADLFDCRRGFYCYASVTFKRHLFVFQKVGKPSQHFWTLDML